MSIKYSIIFIAILTLLFTGCYTQIKMVDRQEAPPEAYQPPVSDYPDYAYSDTVATDSSYYPETEIHNYYIYNSPYWNDPWYTPGWSFSFGFSWGWWDPFWGWNPWYPWYSYCCYYPYPYDPWWGYPYPVSPIYYGKRPFGRRTFTGPRTIHRDSGPPPERHLAGEDNRWISRGGGSVSQATDASGGSSAQGKDARRIVRSSEKHTTLTTRKAVPQKRHIRRTRSVQAQNPKAVSRGQVSSRTSRRYRPAYRGTPHTTRSHSHSYTPRSSSRSSSHSSHSGRRSSSSSHRSSSRSSSSRSVHRR